MAPARAYELGSFLGGFVLYPVYLRGTRIWNLGGGAAAEAEFEKILDHPGIVFAEPIGALATKRHLSPGNKFGMFCITGARRALLISTIAAPTTINFANRSANC